MKSTKAKLWKQVFSFERTICRLIAAWCTFAAFKLFEEGNFYELAFAQDTKISAVVIGTLLLFAVYSVFNYLLAAYESDTWFLLGAATVCVIRWLSKYESSAAYNDFFFMMAVIVVYALFIVYFIHKNEVLREKLEPNSKVVLGFVIVCGLVSGGVIAAITCLRYMTFSSPNFDFGLFVNMFHNMKETGLPLCTSERDVLLSHFVVHISPIYYLLLPFYMIFPSPMTLQIGQAVALASGVIPVMLLCKHFKLSGKATILVAVIYSFYPALSAGCFYDIHENCFLTPLLLWLFYFFEKEKPLPMYIFAFLTLMVKEDAAVYVLLFAVYVILSRKKYLHGAILAIGAAAYFGIALAILESTSAEYAKLYENTTPNPAIAGPMVNRFNNLIFDAAEGLVGAVKTALVNPGYLLTQLFTTKDGGWDKFVYVFQMFLPLGLLPFFTKKASRWLLIVPVLMNLLTYYKYQYDIGFQYHFGIIAFLVYVAIQNIPELKMPTRQNMVAFAAAACCCMYLVSVVPKLNSYTKKWEDGKDMYQEMDRVLDTIPKDASLCVSSMLLAHVADRDVVYELRYHGNEGDVDYVIFDKRYKVDEEMLNAYLGQGYVQVMEEESKKLLILQKGE